MLRLTVAVPTAKLVNGDAGVVVTVGAGGGVGPTAVTFTSEVAVKPPESVAVTRKLSV
jgi:hypothetical protein